MSSTTTDPATTSTEGQEAPKPTPPPSAPQPQQQSAQPPAQEAPKDGEIRLPDDHPLVKAYSLQKEEIRSLKDQRTDAEKVSDRLAEMEKRANEAEARSLRREVALDPTGDGNSAPLSKDDAALLDTVSDETAMRALAARLAANADSVRTNGNYVPTEGTNPRPRPDEKRSFLREITGKG